MSHPTHADIQRVREFLLDLQARICAALEQQEQAGGGSAQFEIDDWQRPEGGGGRSRVLQNGTVIEKGGVMFSHINISKLPASATERHPNIAGGVRHRAKSGRPPAGRRRFPNPIYPALAA